MKKIFCGIILILLILTHVEEVSAHVLITDRNIGALLHVDPNDDPIVGAQSSFFFEIKDKEDKFSSQSCDCAFSVFKQGEEIHTSSLYQDTKEENSASVTAFYTFPSKGIYQIEIQGKPKSDNSFQPFRLTWDFRVEKELQVENNVKEEENFIAENWFLLAVGMLSVILCLVLFARRRKNPIER